MQEKDIKKRKPAPRYDRQLDVRVRQHTRCMKKNKNFPYGQCCCNCRFHLKDSSHPDTDGKSIMKQRGWICNPPEMSTAFSGWEKHGLCGMWAESPERVSA